MNPKTGVFLGLILAFAGPAAFAEGGLIIHGAEIGVGKFHRYDNAVPGHVYADSNVWKPYVLPGKDAPQTPIVNKNADGSVTIFFSTLEDLIESASKVAQEAHSKIRVLNINAHGMPGGTWFPKDRKELEELPCYEWKEAADAPDKDNYDQYYGPVSKGEIMSIRQMADHPGSHYGCVAGVPEWQEIVGRHPEFPGLLADDAQIHLLSCVVGLGKAGEAYAEGLAKLLLHGNASSVQTSVNFGLGDWSMPQGMGFWDYQSDEQLQHDESVYPADRKDSEIEQKGTIRLTQLSGDRWISRLVTDQDFMFLGASSPSMPVDSFLGIESGNEPGIPETGVAAPAPTRVRVPGTGAYVELAR